MKRRTVNLSDAEATALYRFTGDSPDAQTLASLVGDEGVPYSESAAVRALVKLGMDRVREAQLEEGYHNLAQSRTEEDRAWSEASLLMAARLWEGE